MQFVVGFCIWAMVLVNLARLSEVVPGLSALHIGKIVVLIGLILAVSVKGRELTSFFRTTPMGKCVLLIFFLGLVGIPFSVWRGGAVETFSDVSKTLLSAVVLFALAVDGREHTLRWACLGSVMLLALFMVLEKGTGRLQVSSTYDANDIALLFATFLPHLAAEAFCARKIARIALLGASAWVLGCIALTQSRGGIVALVAIALHTFLIAGKRRWILLPLLALGAAVIFAVADDALWARFMAVQDESDYNFTAKEGRVVIWKEGIDLIAHYPILGVGIGQFSAGLGMLGGSGTFKAAHNSFLQIGSELGIFGLTAFVTILFSTFRTGVKGGRASFMSKADRIRYLALSLSATAFCTGGFFLSQAYGTILYTLIPLSAIMYCSLQRAKQNAEQHIPEQDSSVGREKHDEPVIERTPEVLLSNARQSKMRRAELLRRGDRHIMVKMHNRRGQA